MINDLSKSLKALLTQPELPDPLARVDISFERPSEPFKPERTTIDLFAYELRQDRNLRPPPKDGGGPMKISIACSYLITAWPAGGEELALQEQKLLGAVLQVLLGYPVIPAKFLSGTLVGQDPPPRLVLLHPDALGNMSEFWSSLGNRLRPSLSVTATIAVPAFQAPSS